MTDTTGSRGPLGVAVIGYSFMGKAHSNAWRNVGAFHPGLQVRQRVLVGRNEAAVKEAADAFGWDEAAVDWRSVVTRDDIDIVDICTPGATHAEIALAALAAGKHVLVEKPVANTVAEAEQMVAAAAQAARSGVLAGVGFNYRRVPALELARQLIAAGRIGTIRQVRGSYLQDWLVDPAAPMAWRLRREQAGSGVLGDLGSHLVDLVQHLLGHTVVAANGRLRTFVPTRPGPDGPEQVTVDDAAWATLELDSGAIASVEMSRMATGRKNGLTLEVYGDNGALAFDLERLNELGFQEGRAGGALGATGMQRIVVTEADHPWLDAWWPPGHVLGWDHTFTNQAADFLTAIGRGEQPRPSLADGLAVQRVLAAIEESAGRDGAKVEVINGAPTTQED